MKIREVIALCQYLSLFLLLSYLSLNLFLLSQNIYPA